MSTREIEKRLTVVEKEIAYLKADRPPSPGAHPVRALEKIHGSFENDQAFKEANRLGRKCRKSQSAAAAKTRAKKK